MTPSSQICRRAGWLALPLLAGLLALLGLAAPAQAAAAQKVPLTTTNRNCDGTLIEPEQTQPFGFAIIIRTGSNKLIVEVALRNAAPNTTYNFRLIQVLPDNSDCQPFTTGEATLTTDAAGNGNANYQEPVLDDATRAFVAVNNQGNPGGDFFTTPVVSF